MNTSRVNPCSCVSIGSASTNMSASTLPSGKCMMPPKAIGSTKILMINRYSGNSQMARLRCFSLIFSITAIWNWRGRNNNDSIDNRISEAQLPKAMLPVSPPTVSNFCNCGTNCACLNRSPKPSYMLKVTKIPTARKATSFTMDSNAMAATMPSCRSATSRCRVPNRMVKVASSSAIYNVVSLHIGPASMRPVMICG